MNNLLQILKLKIFFNSHETFFAGVPLLPEGPQDGAGESRLRAGGHLGSHQAAQLSPLGELAPPGFILQEYHLKKWPIMRFKKINGFFFSSQRLRNRK